jgi:hypothetical protein
MAKTIHNDGKEMVRKAYGAGRNSIGDNGEVYYNLSDCPEFDNSELRGEFAAGIRSIRGEIRLNACTDWD